MIPLIANNMDVIADICRTYGIRRLDLFGSAATGAFDPETSDIDFIVDLGKYDHGVAERYLDLIAALEDFLGFPIQMITEPSIRNPYFRAAVDEQRITVYESSDSKEAACRPQGAWRLSFCVREGLVPSRISVRRSWLRAPASKSPGPYREDAALRETAMPRLE